MKLPQILLVSLATVSTIVSYSQKQTFQAKDGTTVDVEVLSTDPDEGKHASVYLGLFGPEGVNFGGISYYKPASFYVNVMAGPQGGMADASIFFLSGLRDATDKQSVKIEGSGSFITKYVAKIPGSRRNSFGLHAGTSYIDYSQFANDGRNHFSATGIVGGLSFLTSRFTHWAIDDNNEKQGTLLFRLNADVIYYMNQKFILNKEVNVTQSVNDLSRKIGFRLYFDGKTSAWTRKGRTSVQYMLGVGQNSNRTSKIGVFAGLGLGYNFL